MKLSLRIWVFIIIALFVAAGCSSLPGLQVLAGQDTQSAAEERVAELTDLVMGDKSGNTDPAMTTAADRIEAANNSIVDIIEVRKDLTADTFTVYMLLNMPQGTTQADSNEILRRAIELTWQGTLQQSIGSDLINVVLLSPSAIPTLDKGPSFVGFVVLDAQIARDDVVTYFANRPNTLQDFLDLIAQGKMTIDQPEQEIYAGQPNHPVFMLGPIGAQLRGEQAAESGQSSDVSQ
ncbi:MAG: hypothetical protein JNJ61_21030 [Anaerolineae bacterium]|nr:hypothetical protein [Anaerolineae bacterium]